MNICSFDHPFFAQERCLFTRSSYFTGQWSTYECVDGMDRWFLSGGWSNTRWKTSEAMAANYLKTIIYLFLFCYLYSCSYCNGRWSCACYCMLLVICFSCRLRTIWFSCLLSIYVCACVLSWWYNCMVQPNAVADLENVWSSACHCCVTCWMYYFSWAELHRSKLQITFAHGIPVLLLWLRIAIWVTL
jgi:hypothetical protein